MKTDIFDYELPENFLVKTGAKFKFLIKALLGILTL